MLRTDPIDLLVSTSTNDLVIPPALSSGVAGVVQAVRIRLATIAGEWFLDLDLGVPLFERVGVLAKQAIFGQKFDQVKALAAVRAAILGTPGVTGIKTLTVTFNGSARSLAVSWSAQTAFGDTPVDSLALGS